MFPARPGGWRGAIWGPVCENNTALVCWADDGNFTGLVLWWKVKIMKICAHVEGLRKLGSLALDN